MARPAVRLRKESFGYTIALSTGEVGFYTEQAGPALLRGVTREELQRHRLTELPVGPNFHLKAPLIAWLEITRGCNLPCKHCYVAAGPRRANELSTPEIFATLDQLKALGTFALVIVGGEPTLHPDFLAIVQHAHKLGLVIGIVTNGTRLTQALIDELPREECIVTVSVDGIAGHQDLRLRSTFDDARNALLLLKQNNFPAAIGATQTDRNVEELDQILDFAIEHGFYFSSTPFIPFGRGRLYPEYVPREDIVEPAAVLFRKDVLHEREMFRDNGLCILKFVESCYTLSHAAQREFCGVALVYILSDGSVYPCSLCAASGKYPAGNLRETPFDRLWEHAFQDIRAVTFDDFTGCATCELSRPEYFCTSRCPVMSETLTGDPFLCGATPFVKGSLKRRTELLTWQPSAHPLTG